jgi:hypothetical protein
MRQEGMCGRVARRLELGRVRVTGAGMIGVYSRTFTEK